MADLVKKIKIKKQDGTFTDYIPIGAEAQNINVDGESVAYKLNKKPYFFNTVADMKADTKLKTGDMVITLGYYEINDGKKAIYRIRVIENEDVIDNENIIPILNSNLIAEKIKYSGYELQEQINDINNKEGLYIGTFFEGDDYTGKLRLVTSKDGFNFAHINQDLNIDMRDPSIIFKNDKYYIAYTSGSENWDFKIATTNDLLNFTEHAINIGLGNYSKVWAPEWFEDTNGDLYLLVAAGNELATMELYISKCTDIENFTFTTPTQININNNDTGRIDPYIVKADNIYYLSYTTYVYTSSTVSGEKCKIYSSTDLINWTLVNDDIFPRYWTVEAVCITYQNNRFTIYADMQMVIMFIYKLMIYHKLIKHEKLVKVYLT